MSKTFEALQRAALEKQSKEKVDPGSGVVTAGTSPETVDAPPEVKQEIDSSDPPVSTPPPPSSTEVSTEETAPTPPLSGPQGETDSTLTDLLREHLCGEGDSVLVESDGWVRGHLDREAAASLLRCYALLHCLRQDHDNWFWFWGSSTDAGERARRCGFPLDMAGFD
jgi:hypothetical protein